MSDKHPASIFTRETEFYLSRYNAYPQLCNETVPDDLIITVILPCINEPDVIPSLRSLYECTPPKHGNVEVIVLINASDASSTEVLEQNHRTKLAVENWSKINFLPWIQTRCALLHGLARKHAGAGWARKLAMDEAVRRFAVADNAMGIIASFDADSTCSSNYLCELERTFADESVSGCSIYFEHRLEHDQYSSEHISAIMHYELHLRYLTQAMKWAGAPYAFHTVGSSMAVRVRDYIKIGGMNRRTAGEDFYFLHKIIPRGRFCNLTHATVYPSARISDRVPFGTGAAMRSVAQGASADFQTYQFSSFNSLKLLFSNIDHFYQCNDVGATCTELFPIDMCEYLIQNNITKEVAHISANCASLSSFRTRFIEWFNAFRLIKYLNWMHTDKLERESVFGQSKLLLDALSVNSAHEIDSMLDIYRRLDRKEF